MGWGVWVSKGGCIMDMRDFSSIKLLVSKAAFLAFMIFSWLRLSHFLLTHPDNQIFLVLSKTVVGYWLFLHIIFPFQWMGTCTVIPEQCWYYFLLFLPLLLSAMHLHVAVLLFLILLFAWILGALSVVWWDMYCWWCAEGIFSLLCCRAWTRANLRLLGLWMKMT